MAAGTAAVAVITYPAPAAPAFPAGLPAESSGVFPDPASFRALSWPGGDNAVPLPGPLIAGAGLPGGYANAFSAPGEV